MALPSATAPRIFSPTPRLDMRADDLAGEALDQVRRLGRLADAAQVDDRPDAELAERGAVGVGQAAEMGGAEHRAAAHRGAVGGAVPAEVAEVGAALQRHDEGEIRGKIGRVHADRSITDLGQNFCVKPTRKVRRRPNCGAPTPTPEPSRSW